MISQQSTDVHMTQYERFESKEPSNLSLEVGLSIGARFPRWHEAHPIMLSVGHVAVVVCKRTRLRANR